MLVPAMFAQFLGHGLPKEKPAVEMTDYNVQEEKYPGTSSTRHSLPSWDLGHSPEFVHRDPESNKVYPVTISLKETTANIAASGILRIWLALYICNQFKYGLCCVSVHLSRFPSCGAIFCPRMLQTD